MDDRDLRERAPSATVVTPLPMQKPERLFLAVAIPSDVREAIRAVLPTNLPGRAVRPEQWHLTLRFLGATDAALRDALSESLSRASAHGELGRPFTLRFGGLGAFPTPQRARVLWLGAVEGAEEFASLAGHVERVVSAAGFAAERRAPSAHLTLARLDPPRPLGALLDQQVDVSVPLAVRAVTLFRSELLPQGPRHTRLLEVPLVAPAPS